jgi:hypothetical protein
MGTSAAIRQRQHRDRKRNGIVRLTIYMPHEPLTFALETAGLLPLELLEDRKAIASAVEDLLAEWISRVTCDAEI